MRLPDSALTPGAVSEVEQELAAAEADCARFRFTLARPGVDGSWAEKVGWQLAAAERSVVSLKGMLS